MLLRCVSCQERQDLRFVGVSLCQRCRDLLIPCPPLCPKCGHLDCLSHCCSRPWLDLSPIVSLHSAYLLHEEAFSLLKRWKIHGGPLFDPYVLNFEMGMLDRLGNLGIEAIVPIPQKPNRYWELQRFPVGSISRSLSRLLQVPEAHLLEDTSSRTSQAQSNREERLKKEFRISRRESSRPHSVLLVDDFLTTGQTLLQGARTLAQANIGRNGIHAFALGRKPHLSSTST